MTEYEIEPCINGYKITHTHRDSNDYGDYKRNYYVFADWKGVINHLTNNKLEFATVNG